MQTADNLDEHRLARAVLADKGMDRSGIEHYFGTVERRDRAKSFRH